MSDRITPDKLDTFESHRGEAARLGDRLIVTPRGDIETTDAPGYMTLLIQGSDPDLNRIALLLYDPGSNPEVPGKGMIAQMTADQARTIASSLVRLAERLSPGSTN